MQREGLVRSGMRGKPCGAKKFRADDQNIDFLFSRTFTQSAEPNMPEITAPVRQLRSAAAPTQALSATTTWRLSYSSPPGIKDWSS